MLKTSLKIWNAVSLTSGSLSLMLSSQCPRPLESRCAAGCPIWRPACLLMFLGAKSPTSERGSLMSGSQCPHGVVRDGGTPQPHTRHANLKRHPCKFPHPQLPFKWVNADGDGGAFPIPCCTCWAPLKMVCPLGDERHFSISRCSCWMPFLKG